MPQVQTRAGRLAYESIGSGTPLVLLHSVAHDRHDYDDIVPTLAERFRVIAVDWPGHGESDMWPEPKRASVGGVCDALEDVVEALELPPAVFMGNSVGGTASLRLAARKPKHVRALVLVDSGGVTGQSALVRSFCWVQGRELVRHWTGLAFAKSYLKTRGPGRARVLNVIARQRQRPGFIEMDAALWRSFGTVDNDMVSAASKVTVPTLIVWGKRDPVLPANGDGRRLRDLISHAKYAELDTGHVPFVENPRAFLDAVSPFLASPG